MLQPFIISDTISYDIRLTMERAGDSIMKYLIGLYCVVFLLILSGCDEIEIDTPVEVKANDIVMANTENSQLSYNLPPPETKGAISVEEALASRRSRRNFQDKELSVEKLSQILWAAYGISEPGRGLRTAPSAGATYPLEIHVAVGKVAGVEPGVYRYDPHGHKIIRTVDRDIRGALSDAALSQTMVRDAPVTVIHTAIFERIAGYGDRGRERYVFMEIGHSAQNIYLQAETLGLGTCAIGAFMDDRVKDLLRLPADEEPLYLMPVGYTRN